MADEEKVTTTTGAEGAAGDTGTRQDAEPTSQDTAQDQTAPQAEVGQTDQTSSEGQQAGKQRGRWSTERLVERAIKSQMEPLLEKLNTLSTPAAPEPQQEDFGTPDYNNLEGWLKTVIPKLVERRMSESLPKSLESFKGELKNASRTQEARNYLISQEDIGDNEAKLEQVEQVMKEHMLDFAAVHQPLRAVQKAVKIWRDGRTNPTAPTKQMLGTVTGGAAPAGKHEPSVKELIGMQLKLASGLPMDEQEKLHKEIDTLLTSG